MHRLIVFFANGITRAKWIVHNSVKYVSGRFLKAEIRSLPTDSEFADEVNHSHIVVLQVYIRMFIYIAYESEIR